jgi:hypothetical protein
VSVADLVRDYGPLVGLAGVTITLYVNGRRTDRTVRRETRSRAIEAVVAYQEMPYAIRRRRHEAEHRSAERVRLTETFTAIQAELASCEALMRADPDASVRDGYANLVARLRTCRRGAGILGLGLHADQTRREHVDARGLPSPGARPRSSARVRRRGRAGESRPLGREAGAAA